MRIHLTQRWFLHLIWMAQPWWRIGFYRWGFDLGLWRLLIDFGNWGDTVAHRVGERVLGPLVGELPEHVRKQ